MNPPSPRQPDLLDFLIFPIFAALFFLTLLIFDPLQRLAILVSKDLHEKTIYGLNYTLIFLLKAVLQVEIQIDVKDERALSGQHIIISNHQSLYDIPLLYLIFRAAKPRYIAKKELGKWIPSVSFNLRRGGNVLIDRKNPRQAIPAIAAFAEQMSETKYSPVLFPEGTRARDGKLKTFHAAGITKLLEIQKDLDVVPVTLDGSWILALGVPIRRKTKVTVLVGEPISQNSFASPKELIENLRNCVDHTLGELRH